MAIEILVRNLDLAVFGQQLFWRSCSDITDEQLSHNFLIGIVILPCFAVISLTIVSLQVRKFK